MYHAEPCIPVRAIFFYRYIIRKRLRTTVHKSHCYLNGFKIGVLHRRVFTNIGKFQVFGSTGNSIRFHLLQKWFQKYQNIIIRLDSLDSEWHYRSHSRSDSINISQRNVTNNPYPGIHYRPFSSPQLREMLDRSSWIVTSGGKRGPAPPPGGSSGEQLLESTSNLRCAWRTHECANDSDQMYKRTCNIELLDAEWIAERISCHSTRWVIDRLRNIIYMFFWRRTSLKKNYK